MSTEYLNNEEFEKIITIFQMAKQLKCRYEMLIEDLESAKSKRAKKKLQDKLNDYDEVSAQFEEIKKQLAVNFYTLSENLAKYAKFNLIDMDDAIQEGVMIGFEKIDKFDKNKGKAFNYMTTCIFNHYRQLYRTARNYNELKIKFQAFLETKTAGIPIKTRKNHYSRKINE